MKLLIEEWAENNLSDNTIEIMKEAVMCYKIRAYRSAFLMSYLAFKLTIRERVLVSITKPDSISESSWNNEVISVLRNDDKWEDCINNMLTTAPDNPKNCLGKVFVFTNREKVKSRYEAWKYTRHSCAHGKEEQISSATVEQFWNYMQDDLPEYYVLGGKKYLGDELYRSYRYFYSLKSSHLNKLLKDISSVYKNNVKQCFDELYEKDKSCISINESNVEFWDTVLVYNDANVTDGFIDFLYSHNDYFLDWYTKHPKLFYMMVSKHDVFIQESLAPMLEKGYYIDQNTFWNLLCDILQLDAKLLNLYKITSDYNKFKMIETIDLAPTKINILKQYGVFNSFLWNAGKDLFNNSGDAHWDYYAWGNGKDDTYIIKCFDYITWDVKLIEKIENNFKDLKDNIESRTNSDSKYNGHERIRTFKEIIESSKDKIKEVCKDNNINLENFPYINEFVK
ncbi:MAG: hypothetical protein LKE46_09650 [Clostridium sp.]|jgi:hypothetical protein|uniref:hypothetical protein n=1 Tax=Clostridium sp. TaxID=1506 RepID=UPI0025C1EA31|nr:hypothetical protein [Clostridium sp.]MCH3964527.1 hypothetical protein [Clostridium sp.]MCI1714998.1 hypothetical protein [Clostridium sp.]MCI1799260.1 hypothetical protein [Clostridium sp.]MCI1813181.1 hypothetical protein [Clostridium sp.]MCI1870072.1 hypothetical protein [Clostridium sp.]